MSERKRILFILHMPPPVHGAAVVGKAIHDSALINDEFDCRFINLATASGLEDIGKFRFAKISRFSSLLSQIRREVKSFRPDLIYITPNSHGNAFYKDWLTVRMLKKTGIPVLAHFHNKGVKPNSGNAIKRSLYRSFFRGLNVILLSQRLFADIEDFADSDRVYICPNGIADSTRTLHNRRENSKPHILFISNLLVDKGIMTLLDALKEVSEKGHDFVCDIAGAETSEIDNQRLNDEIVRRGLENHVTYHGPVYGEEKEKLFDTSDIFVFPTANEALPIVCLEAMKHSLPVISTDEGGIPDIVIDGVTGLIRPKQDADAFAKAIVELLTNNELRTNMGAEGRQHFEKLFTVSAFEKSLSEILRSLA